MTDYGPTANGRVIIGTGRRVCYALGIWPLEIVARPTIRAMLPQGLHRQHSLSTWTQRRAKGDGSTGKNVVSREFGNTLSRLERDGLIRRGKVYLQILDRQELFDRAVAGITVERVEFLSINHAVSVVQGQLDRASSEVEREQALRELQAIYDLMKSGLSGAFHSGKGSAAFVPHGWRGRPS